MVPMTEEEVKALMTKGVAEFEKDKVKKDSKDTETTAARDGGDVPKGLGGVGLPVAEKAVRRTEEEVADLVGAVTESEPVLDDDARDPSNEPKPPTPPVPVAATPVPPPDGLDPVGSVMLGANVKRTLDGFRSRMALLAQCACFVTAPALAGTTVPNLFAPVVSGRRATCCSSRIRDWPCAGSSRTPTARCQAASSPRGTRRSKRRR